MILSDRISDACYKDRGAKLEEIDFRKRIMLLIVALVGVIGSSFIQIRSIKLGGVFTLIVALTLYWSKYKEATKTIISGLSLLLVIVLSVRLYKIENIVDIFALEFGTKAKSNVV